MSELKDPNLPPKAIFKVNDDCSAVRNDGLELAAANSNIWYVLATIYREQGGDWDTDLEVKNQQAWNGWVYQNLSREKQGSFAEDFGFTHDEMTVLKNVDRKAIRKAFQLRLPGIEPPKTTERCKFSKNYFSKPVSFKKYAFVKRACFHEATFSRKSDFREAVFSGYANFSEASFCEDVGFHKTIFSQHACFCKATFNGNTDFYKAKYYGNANFPSAIFNGSVDFHYVVFNGFTLFEDATFGGAANFSSAVFNSKTVFDKAKFLKFVPTFHAAELYDHTTFTLLPNFRDNWPPLQGEDVMPAAEQKRAYNRLRLFMNKSLQIDEEQFFHRQEMRCKQALATTKLDKFVLWAYANFSDFGWDVRRPTYYLFLLFLTGWIPMLGNLVRTSKDFSIVFSSAGWSISNIFPFFGFRRLFSSELSNWYDVLAGVQTVSGFILLFLLGLGLRNRFRLR